MKFETKIVRGNILPDPVTGGIPVGKIVMNSVKLCQLAESLGSVDTMITHPATMTHAEVLKLDRESQMGLFEYPLELNILMILLQI